MNIDRYELESDEKWLEWAHKIPSISLPPEWLIQVIPPFCGAMVRFRVRTLKIPVDMGVSIYLDCYDNLGSYGSPYWEAYPVHGNTFRCGINEVQKLLLAIRESITEIENEESK